MARDLGELGLSRERGLEDVGPRVPHAALVAYDPTYSILNSVFGILRVVETVSRLWTIESSHDAHVSCGSSEHSPWPNSDCTRNVPRVENEKAKIDTAVADAA